MKTRLNAKFIALSSLSMLVIVGAIAGVYTYTTHNSPTSHIKQAEHYESIGAYDKAAEQFQSAIREQNDPKTRQELSIRWLRNVEKTETTSVDEASNHFREVLLNWARISQGLTDHQEARDRWLELAYQRAKLIDNLENWQWLYDQANRAVRLAPRDPQTTRLRALAGFQLLHLINLQLDKRQTLLNDLKKAYQHNKQDAEIVRAYAAYLLFESRDARNQGLDDRANDFQQQGVELVRSAVSNAMDLLSLRITQIQILNYYYQIEPNPNAHSTLMHLLAKAEKMVNEQTSAEDAIMLSNLLQRIDQSRNAIGQQNGKLRAIACLNTVAAANTQNVGLRLTLARYYQETNQYDEAILHYRAIQIPTSFKLDPNVIILEKQVLVALTSLAEIYLARTNQAQTISEKNKFRILAISTADKIAETFGKQNVASRLLHARADITDGKLKKGLRELMTVNGLINHRDFNAQMVAADTLLKLNQTGPAIVAITRALEIESVDNYKKIMASWQLAQLHLKAGNTSKASQYILALRQQFPDRPEFLLLEAKLLHAQASILTFTSLEGRDTQLKKAGQLLLPLVDQNNLEAISTYARIRADLGETEEAINLLTKTFKSQLVNEDSSPRILLQLLNRITEFSSRINQTDAIEQLSAFAVKRFPSDPLLQLFHLRITQAPAEEIYAFTIQQIMQDQNLYNRYLQLYQFHRSQDEQEKADNALARVFKINVNDPQASLYQFQDALTLNRFDEIKRLIQVAEELNLDDAEGIYWQGQWELLRGQLKEASASLSQANDRWPWRGQSWRELGDAQLMNQDFDGALKSYEKAHQLMPSDLIIIDRLLRYYDANLMNNEAEALLQRVALFADRYAERYIQLMQQTRRYRKAIRLREHRQRIHPADHSNVHQLADLYFQTGEKEKSVQLLAAQYEKFPEPLNALAYAQSLINTEQQDKLKQLIGELKTNASFEAWFNLARIYRNNNQLQKAISTAQSIATSDANPAQLTQAMRLLAALYFEDEKFTMAYQTMAKQISMKSTVQDWFTFADYAIAANDAEVFKAKLKPMQAEKINLGLYYILRAYVTTNSTLLYDDPKASISQSRQFSMHKPYYHLFVAQYSMDNRDMSKTQTELSLKRLLQIQPRHAEGHQLLLNFYIKEKRNEDTIRQLNQMVYYFPNNPQLRIKLAENYIRLKQLNDLNLLINNTQKDLPAFEGKWQYYKALSSDLKNDLSTALLYYEKAWQNDKSENILLAYADALLRSKKTAASHKLLGQAMTDQATSMHYALFALTHPAGFHAPSANKALQLCGNNYAMSERLRLKWLEHVSLEKLGPVIQAATKDSNAAKFQSAMLALNNRQAAEAAKTLIALKEDGEIDPQSKVLLLRKLSLAAQLQQDTASAITYLEETLDLDQKNIITMNNLALLYRTSLNVRHQAMPLIEEAIQVAGQNHRLYANLLDSKGQIAMAIGQRDIALQSFTQSVAIKPTLNNQLNLADLYISLLQFATAKRLLNSIEPTIEKSGDEQLIMTLKQLRTKIKNKPQ